MTTSSNFKPRIRLNADDLHLGEQRNRWGCVIVRAIQRTYPDAINVRVDKQNIAFSLVEDDTRYTFDTPAAVVNKVIKPFDEQGPAAVGLTQFTLSGGTQKPIHHNDDKARARNRQYDRRKLAKQTTREKNSGKAFNRFTEGLCETPEQIESA